MTPRPPIESMSSALEPLPLSLLLDMPELTLFNSHRQRPILLSCRTPLRRPTLAVRRPDLHTQPDQIPRECTQGIKVIGRIRTMRRLPESIFAERKGDAVYSVGYGSRH